MDWLGTETLTWRDLSVIIRHMPPSSALGREIRGDAAPYIATDYLLVNAVNLLQNMSWQLAQDRKLKKPEPIWLPGMNDTNKTTSTWSGDQMTVEEMNARLGW